MDLLKNKSMVIIMDNVLGTNYHNDLVHAFKGTRQQVCIFKYIYKFITENS